MNGEFRERNNSINNQAENKMSKFLKALRVAGDVAEIIVASSIVVEFIERFRAKKKAQVQTVEPAEETDDAAEIQTTENK